MSTPADGATIQFENSQTRVTLKNAFVRVQMIIITALKEMTRIQCNEWFEIDTIDC